MQLIKLTKPIDEDEKDVPKGWHLPDAINDVTLCGLDYYSGYVTKEGGRVTCSQCKELVRFCRNKEIKL